jgi:predicted small lipoprotein YifL
MNRYFLRFLLVGMAAFALGACGRRGPLEAPPTAAASKGPSTTVTESVPNEDSFAQPINASPIAKPPRTSRAITVPKRDFILDPIL